MAEFVFDLGGVERDAPEEVKKRVAALDLKLQSRGLVGQEAYRFEGLQEPMTLAREYGLEFGMPFVDKRGVFDAHSGFFVGLFYLGQWDGKHHGFFKRELD